MLMTHKNIKCEQQKPQNKVNSWPVRFSAMNDKTKQKIKVCLLNYVMT